MQIYIVGSNQEGQRLDKFLKKYFPNAENSFIYKMLRKKNITLNGKKAEGKEILTAGDEIKSFFSEETFWKMRGKTVSESQKENYDFQKDCHDPYKEYRACYHALNNIALIYENKDIVIFHKPVGVLSQKAKWNDYSLNEYLIGYLLERGFPEEDLETYKPSVLNRLDRNTAGLVLCGKSLMGSQVFSRLLAERKLHKYYLTVVYGEMKSRMEEIAYLSKDKEGNKVSVITKTEYAELDASAKALYRMIHTGFTPLLTTKDRTLVEVELFTGKSHQIRAHLSALGYPMVGDTKYGVRESGLRGQLLLAYRLVFPSEADLPDSCKSLAEKSFFADIPKEYLHYIEDIFSKEQGYANLEIKGLKRIDS